MAVKFTIGEVAKALGISQERIRHYVNEGLIQPERQKDNNYLYYSSEDVLLITDVLFYRSMGLTIKQIKTIMKGLPLREIGGIISQRKRELILEVKELLDQLNTLQLWDDKYNEELNSVGKFVVGKMPPEYKYPGFVGERDHIVECLKEGFSLEKSDWGSFSLSFYINTNKEEETVRRYIAIDDRVKVNPGMKDIYSEEYSAPQSISTVVEDNDDIMRLIEPLKEYAENNNYKLTGEFYGRENTNYFVDNRRYALYRVYAVIENI